MSRQGERNRRPVEHRNRGRARGRGGRGGRRHEPDQEDGHRNTARDTAAAVPRTEYWTYDTIRELSRRNAQDIVDRVQHEHSSFIKAFQYERFLEMRNIHFLIKILSGLANSSSEAEFSARVISEVFENCPKFMMKLKEYIQTSDKSYQLDPIVRLGHFCITRIPQSTVFAFPQSELREAIESLSDDEAIQKIFVDYDATFRETKAHLIKQKRESGARSSGASSGINPHDAEPPNNFREIEILPQPEEIKNSHEKPFLRPNLKKGSYRDWNHYLDVQFRLLREDFMGPLREEIHNYLQGKE